MKLIELMKNCDRSDNVTSIQRLQRCSSYIGSGIEMIYKIADIVPRMIFLNLREGYENDYVYSGIEEKYNFHVSISYENDLFLKQLSNYSKGDVVKLIAKLVEVDYSTSLNASFILMSIEKSNLKPDVE